MRIDKICSYYGIKNYTINPNGSIDVNGDVSLYGKELTQLPICFNTVTGIFNCSYNFLTTLKGSPIKVGGDFNCIRNKLTNLMYGPKEVGGDYFTIYNKITEFNHYPNSIGNLLYCDDIILPNGMVYKEVPYNNNYIYYMVTNYNDWVKFKNREDIINNIIKI